MTLPCNNCQGYCARHKMEKTATMVTACRNDEAYREAMDIQAAATPEPATFQFGDFIESALSNVGLTKDRYKQIKGLFGMPPTCNCDERQEWLNRVGEWWQGGLGLK